MGSKVNIFSHLYVILYFVIIIRAEDNEEKLTSVIEVATEQVSPLVNTTTASSAGSSRWFPKIFTRLHGCVLVISWLGLTPISMLIARYYKPELNYDQLGFGQLWFQIHRILMYINLVLNILGAIFIYMRIGGWSGAQFHTVLGVTAMSLMLVQVFYSTFFRPAVISPKRWIFNWAHYFTGNLCFILSIITIYCSLDYRLIKTRRNQIFWFLNASVLLTLSTVVVLQIHKFYITKKRAWFRKDIDQIKMSPMAAEAKAVPHNDLNGLFKISTLQLITVGVGVCTTAICVNIMNP